MASAFEELEEFEKQADIEIAKLSIWKLPIRSILSLIYLSADGHYIGKRFNRRGSRNAEVGTAMITRMSCIVRLLSKCSREIGGDIDEAISVVNDQFVDDFEQLFGYVHFCEILPQVRRGFFSVERHASTFVLKHPNEEFVKHEETDILMSEMVLPHDMAPPPYPIESCKRMIKAWPEIPGDELLGVLRGAYDHYLENVIEFPLLSDEAFQESFGFPRADFIRVRAGLMAYADFCLGMADAAEVLSARAFTRPKREILQREVREWVAPLLSRNHIIGITAGVSAVEPSVAERIVDLFTIDPDNVDSSGAGEGFFPPFLRLNDALLFSPHAVKRTMPERNLLYAMVRTDKKTFDNVVSRHLEPALIEEAVELLLELDGVEVRKNVNWDKGEIDLVAYHEASNSAFQLQAKAGVSPQGARMVAQVESRTLEAANQVQRFLSLSGTKKDEICSSAFGRKLSGITWSSGILVRSCLGTEKAWNGIKGFIPLNPVLLRAAVRRMSERGEFTFMNVGEVIEDELARFRSVAVTGWENRSFTLFGEEVMLPLLNLNPKAISEFRLRAAS
jgi:Holliday junction resolvase-like predicted endonuclease